DVPVTLVSPGRVYWAPRGQVGLAVSIVVARHWYVALRSPLFDERSGAVVVRGREKDEPVSLARPPHGQVGLVVAIVVARHRYVALLSPLSDERSGVVVVPGRVKDVPVTIVSPGWVYWARRGEVGRAVPIVVGRCGHVALGSPLGACGRN